MNEEQNKNTEEKKTISFEKFLEAIPPGRFATISPLDYNSSGYDFYSELPEITLHCDSEFCNGERFFKSDEPEIYLKKGRYKFHFITYRCKNCQQTSKTLIRNFKSRHSGTQK